MPRAQYASATHMPRPDPTAGCYCCPLPATHGAFEQETEDPPQSPRRRPPIMSWIMRIRSIYEADAAISY